MIDVPVEVPKSMLERLMRESNEAGLEHRKITGIQFTHDGSRKLTGFRLDWVPAPRAGCNCGLCQR